MNDRAAPSLDYRTPPAPRLRRQRTSLLQIVVAIFLVALFVSILLPSMSRQRYSPHRVKCNNQLGAIGQAIMLYANEHDGRYPAGAADIVVTQDLAPALWVCPSSEDTPAAPGPTPDATAANVLARGHLSYVLLCKGFTSPPPPDAVLAYEPLANHRDEGMHVLFGDGHVDFLQPSLAKKLLAELNAGHNPPRAEVIQ